ncbi:extracellular solute-binding protein [Paenibacillus sp. UNCCL117]|uniref:ABC transporter substrate-binding protein n=1 Tax=unclassified Paenibacillus TaxID=185978 RepID=UPI0008906887|nr:MULTISPECIES: sugar ABC transporter substrate-binding protein [unclassified Paenibacillus]SDD07200.1 carbohydrate ABC transporter substrate-binding protein, CUT1 family [Paenibacillus sp. cl123]SFW31534.1 extracellular solute-binding protein [Paenibacillus sp. UNCCL117]
MKKLVNKGVAVLIMASLAAGCAGGSEPKPAGAGAETTAGNAKPVKLTVWAGTGFKDIEGYDSKNYGDWEKAKAKEFQKLHPNVTIQVESVPFTEIEQKVNVAVAGNNPPDILYDNIPIRISKHARNGVLEELEAVVSADKADWKEAFLQMGTINGKLYALPLGSVPQVMFLNKTIFDKHGVTLPQDRSWTWNEMKDALKKAADKNIYGIAYFAKNEQADQVMVSNLLAAGAQWANKEMTEYTINGPAGVEALSFMLSLQDEGLVAPGTATMDISGNFELFKQGKLAILNHTSPVFGDLEAGKKNGAVDPSVEVYGMIPVVKEGVTPRITVTGENGYAIFKQTDEEKKKTAIEFVKFLTQSDNIKAINKATYGISARKSATYEITNKDAAQVFELLNRLEIVDLGKNKAYFSTLRQKFYPEMQAAFLKTKTPKQALDDFVKNANELAAKK